MGHISEREQQLPDLVIGKLLEIAAEHPEIISLGPGEPDFLPPKQLLDYTKKVLVKSTKYSSPAGMTILREAIAEKLRKQNKISADADEIIVTTGSQEAIFAALIAATDPGEQIIVPNPGYLGYVPAIYLVSATPAYVKLSEDNGWQLNPDSVKDAVEKGKTKGIIINSPSNPTGTVYKKKLLEEVADIAVENDLYVFSDEAYEWYTYDDAKHVSIGSLNGMSPYVVTLQSFSKSFGLMGFRLGYAHGPKKLIEAITKIHHYTTLCAPVHSQLAGVKALSMNPKFFSKIRKDYNNRRKYALKRAAGLGLPTVEPKGAFYMFSGIKNYTKSSRKFMDLMLKKAKVAVVPGTEFGKYGEGFIRISYATELSQIKRAFDRMESVLEKW